MRPRLIRLLLLLLLGAVVAINASYLHRNPFPPLSQHRAFQLVHRTMHHFLGYTSQTREPYDNLDASGGGYILPVRNPVPWTQPARLLHEFQVNGRMYPLYGKCHASYWRCMPHNFALSGMIAALVPGNPTLAGLGVTAYFLLLLLAMYGIGSEIKDRETGLTAAAIAAGYPGLFGYSRWIEGYLPVTALTVGMVYCLLRSQGFTRWLPALGFAVLAWTTLHSGEGLSEPIGAGITVTGPFLATLWYGVSEARRERRAPFRTLGTVFMVMLFLLLTLDYPWLREGMGHLLGGFSDPYDAPPLRSPRLGPTERWIMVHAPYLVLILTQYLKPLMFAWLLLALPLFLFRPVYRKWTVALWFIIPLIAYSSMARKAQWYALPIVPPLALITAVGLSTIRRTWLRSSAMLLASTIAVVQMMVFSIAELQNVIRIPMILQNPLRQDVIEVRRSRLIEPFDRKYMVLRDQIREFVKWLDEHVPQTDSPRYIALVSGWNGDVYDGQIFQYVMTLSRPDFEVINLTDPSYLEQSPYPGLRPEYFAFYVHIGANGIDACFDSDGQPRLTHADLPQPVPPALRDFAAQLLARARGTVPGLPILVLDHAGLQLQATSAEEAPWTQQ